MSGKIHSDSAIELLIIEESPNDAEAMANALRNAGMTIHLHRDDKEEDLIETLAKSNLDLILYTFGTGNIEPRHILSLLRKAAVDIPLIIIFPDATEQEFLIDALKKGARDAVTKQDSDRLTLIVSREIQDLRTRRELQQSMELLRDMEQRCNSLVENSRDAIAYIHEGMYIKANQAYLNMFGYVDMSDIEGLPILDMVAPDDHSSFKEFLRSIEKSEEAAKLETHCRNSSDKIFDAELEFTPASMDGEPCTQIIIRDQSINKKLEQEINQLTKLDPHTGLSNRQYFMDQLDELVSGAAASEPSCALLFILLDDFQKLRSAAGIAVCDDLLTEVAKILQEKSGENDLVARFGDHTFVLLSGQLSTQAAESFGEELRVAIAGHEYQSLKGNDTITCSIGISYLTDDTKSGQDLVNEAYNACEAIRDQGGNMVSSYDESEMRPAQQADTEGSGSQTIKELIRQALEQDRFRLVYQPIVSLQGDTRENYAVLTRLLDENGDEILPKDFLGMKDEPELMNAIDRWVIKNSIMELAKQRGLDHKIKFFICLSVAAIEDETMLLWICDCLREYNAKGAWLTFQFRDTDLREHTQNAKKLIDGLSKIRCQLAIDHFGENPKPEMLLKHLSVDYVKLDRSLTQGLASSQQQQDKLHNLNRLAQSFGVKSVALGVEDANSLAVLWTIGVNYIQGNFLQKPTPTIAYDFSSI